VVKPPAPIATGINLPSTVVKTITHGITSTHGEDTEAPAQRLLQSAEDRSQAMPESPSVLVVYDAVTGEDLAEIDGNLSIHPTLMEQFGLSLGTFANSRKKRR
jgi:hypothetical protein